MDKALVIFSGGQDSTTCLVQAIKQYGREQVETVSFNYGQRHAIELDKARFIAHDLGVKQMVIDTRVLTQTSHNALLDDKQVIESPDGEHYPNTFVAGRNALFIILAASYAYGQGIAHIITGVCETDYSGYPDCREVFIQSINQSINLAMDFQFTIHTPLMYLTKAQTWQLADELGYLDYIMRYTHTCYYGVEHGCHQCPSCLLREQGLRLYLAQK